MAAARALRSRCALRAFIPRNLPAARPPNSLSPPCNARSGARKTAVPSTTDPRMLRSRTRWRCGRLDPGAATTARATA
eukprot:11199938-Lingulodinium_polyedra.AAC.1